jgi:hypothetical protein
MAVIENAGMGVGAVVGHTGISTDVGRVKQRTLRLILISEPNMAENHFSDLQERSTVRQRQTPGTRYKEP